MGTSCFICISDEPSKPNNVELVDWDKDHADLKWTKPEKDGGAPITGYIIEYKVIPRKFKFVRENIKIIIRIINRKSSEKIG